MEELSIDISKDHSLLEKSDILRTPCQHIFHEECLKNWVHKKRECPNCRAPLPCLQNTEDEEN